MAGFTIVAVAFMFRGEAVLTTAIRAIAAFAVLWVATWLFRSILSLASTAGGEDEETDPTG